MLPANAIGKLFRSESGEIFGALRPPVGRVPKALSLAHGEVFAEDECGNYFFSQGGEVLFWDHETGEFRTLADSLELFLARLERPTSPTLDRGQVKRVWIAPAFADRVSGKPKSD